jgi:hypothetical protein
MGHNFKSQGAKQPTAMGSLLQSSAYGSAIPVIYGMTQSPPLAIWAANLRQGGSIKKGKQFKKGITDYVEDIDFLIAHNPVRGVCQIMNNGSLVPLTVSKQSFTYPNLAGASVEVTDPDFYFVIAVTIELPYSFDVNDYGSQGPQTLTGTYEVPCWNCLENGPDPTDESANRNSPFTYVWEPPAFGADPENVPGVPPGSGQGAGANIFLDRADVLAGTTVNVYYFAIKPGVTKDESPLAFLRLFFENKLGSGNQYTDAGLPAQQIIYDQFAGVGSTEIDLGASGALPQLLFEVAGKWGIYPSGDGDFVDMIEDIFKSGLAQGAIGG